MNDDQLLAHFDRIAEAPDSVASLRRLILNLAVRGKLVTQDVKDEPASVLLKNIQSTKATLVSSGEIKKPDSFAPVNGNEIPFSIPIGWETVQMGWLARKLGAGSTPLGGKTVYQSVGIPFLRSQNVHNDGLRLDDVAYISPAIHDRMSGTHVQKQDILLNITGASIGRCALVPESFVYGNVSQHVAIVRLYCPAIREFIHLSLTSPFFQKVIDDVQVGVSREGLSMQRLKQFPMLIPPLAEQRRIVAKVDELMALCDRLEAAQAQRERRRDRLAAASLNRLNRPDDDATAYRAHARFHLDHLPRFTVRPDQIPALRQTILNLAVRGRLVPQDPKDEQASELLKRIQAENAKDGKQSESAVQKRQDKAIDGADRFSIPLTWQWVSLGTIAFGLRYGTSIKCSYEPQGEPVLRIPNVANGVVDIEDLKYGPLTQREADDLRLRIGDILMVRSNGSLNLVGRPALVDAKAAGFCYAGYLVRVRTSEANINARFTVIALSTTDVRDQIEIPIRTTVGLKNVNATELGGLMFPLPPLAEQHRIVAKVDELMGLCDRLEAQLTTAQTESRRLLEAVLHEALAPNENAGAALDAIS